MRIKKFRTILSPININLKYYSKFKDPKFKYTIFITKEMLIRKGLKYTLSILKKQYKADIGDYKYWD